MGNIDKYGFADVDYWNENIPAFKNIFNGVLTYISFNETASEIFSLFEMMYGKRLMFKQYPETDADIPTAIIQLTNYCSIFARTYKYKYTHMLKTEKAVYNPIENYSMTENGTDTRTPDLVTDMSNSSNSKGIGTSNSDTVTGVTTYDNTADFINQNKGTDSTNTETTTENTATEKTTTTGTEKTEHTLTRSGNIGVTTSQQMLQSERDLADFSTIRKFIDDIADVICLSVY